MPITIIWAIDVEFNTSRHIYWRPNIYHVKFGSGLTRPKVSSGRGVLTPYKDTFPLSQTDWYSTQLEKIIPYPYFFNNSILSYLFNLSKLCWLTESHYWEIFRGIQYNHEFTTFWILWHLISQLAISHRSPQHRN